VFQTTNFQARFTSKIQIDVIQGHLSEIASKFA